MKVDGGRSGRPALAAVMALAASLATPRAVATGAAILEPVPDTTNCESPQGGAANGAAFQSGDTAWIHSFFPDRPRPAAGGDCPPEATATTSAGGSGTREWGRSASLAANIESWLDTDQNFGRIVLGDQTAMETAKGFESRRAAGAGLPALMRGYPSPAPPTVLPSPTASPNFSSTSTPPPPTPTPTPPAPLSCVGDCDEDGHVSIAELIRGVGIALGTTPAASCPAFDADADGVVAVDELVRAVRSALEGCISPPPTATPEATPTPPRTDCKDVDIRIVFDSTDLVPGTAEARFREQDDCRRSLRVQLEDVPPGTYVLVAGAQERARIEVGPDRFAELELADPPDPGKPRLDFEPRGTRLQILRDGQLAFSVTIPSEGSLVVLTYNVAGLPEGISGSHPSVNTVQISPLLSAYDLVVVQEDFCFHADLISALDLPFLSAPEYDPGCTVFVGPDRDIGDGLNRFARFPFTGFTRFDWAVCNGTTDCSSDCLTEKGFTVGRHFLGPGAEVDVYNVHMDAGSCPGDQAARSAQVDQLLAEIAVRSDGRAVIVAGDTNLKRRREGDGEILDRLLDGAGLVDACVALQCGDDRIDRVLFRSGGRLDLRAVRWWIPQEFHDAEGSPLSDHEPVAVEIDWSVAG